MNSGIYPRTIVTDFDVPMCTAIEITYIKSTHLLSQWHMMQHLKKHFIYLQKRKSSTSKLLFNHIIDAIYCDSSKRFIELQDVIFQQTDQLDSQKMDYLRRLFQIKEKWASAHIPAVFTGGMNSMQRMETINQTIKKTLFGRYTLENLFLEILKVETRLVKLTREFVNTQDMSVAINHPLINEVKLRYSKWAFEQMLF